MWNMVNRTRASYLRWAIKVMRKAFKEQTLRITDQLAQGIIPSDLEVQDYPIEQAYLKIYTTIGARFGNDVFRALRPPQKDFQVDNFLLAMQQYINIYGGDMIKSITFVTKTRIRNIIDRTIRMGLPVEEAASQIAKEINVMSFRRSITIARTEVIRSSNVGAMQGANMSGLELNKEWISFFDKATRQGEFDHIRADGEIVPMSQPFIMSGEPLDHPVDPQGSAGNTINCRCSVAFIPQ